MQFLYESNLISDSRAAQIIALGTADFTFADLSFSYLYNANLRGADLSYANLRGADLKSANLIHTNLTHADLKSADLTSTDLKSANLTRADLKSANLTGANLYSIKNLTHEQIKLACSWEKAIYVQNTSDEPNNGFLAQDEEANQKEIEKIKQDKASDPPKPPDCSRWQ